MLTREKIARDKNISTSRISRKICVNEKLNISKGMEFPRTGKAESWTDGGEFKEETEREYTYILRINNKISGHKVDYDREDEEYFEALGSSQEMYDEKEILIIPDNILEITRVSSDDDYEEMGYYLVELEAR